MSLCLKSDRSKSFYYRSVLDLFISCFCVVRSVVSISFLSNLLINLCKIDRSGIVVSKSDKKKGKLDLSFIFCWCSCCSKLQKKNFKSDYIYLLLLVSCSVVVSTFDFDFFCY